MSGYAVRRLAQFVPTLLMTTFLVFFAMSKTGGNSVSSILPENATADQVREAERQLGLDKSVFERYFLYMAGIANGDMGRSHVSGEDAHKALFRALPNTLRLSFLSLLMSVAIAVPLGIISAVRSGGALDFALSSASLANSSLPTFWLSLMLMALFSLKLGLFPSGGAGSFRHYVLPSVSIAIGLSGLIYRMTRVSMIDALSGDYVLYARAKGVSDGRIILRHCLVNAAPGIVTAIFQQASYVLTGSVLAETVFSIPGIGRLVFQSIAARDTPLVTGGVVLCCLMMSLVNFLADLVCAWLDPRVRDRLAAG